MGAIWEGVQVIWKAFLAVQVRTSQGSNGEGIGDEERVVSLASKLDRESKSSVYRLPNHRHSEARFYEGQPNVRLFPHVASTGSQKVVHFRVVTNFGYHPTTLPDPPSPLRRLAYSEGSPLIGPEGDPEGWKVLPQVKIRGTLFGTKEVEVDCTVRPLDVFRYASTE